MKFEFYRDIPQVQMVGKPIMTLPWEVSWMINKIKSCPGNILELGTFIGNTTLELASAFPDRLIHTIELPDDEFDAHSKRCNLGADHTEICKNAKHLPNVRLHQLGDKFVLSDEYDIGFAFIDDNHTWAGVHSATMRVLPKMKRGTIVWHDYFYANCPSFGIFDYLNSMEGNLVHVVGTSLVYLDIK